MDDAMEKIGNRPRWANPASAGWSAARLAEARAYADTLTTEAVMVVAGGRVVCAWGNVASRYNVHSIRKSLLSALIGIHEAAGRIDLEAVSLEPAQVIRGVVEICRPQAQAKGLTLRIELDPSLPSQALGDPGRLSQVLGNLVNNAVKFTSSGEVCVRARARDGGAGPRRGLDDLLGRGLDGRRVVRLETDADLVLGYGHVLSGT